VTYRLAAMLAVLLVPLLSAGCPGLPGAGGANDARGRGDWHTSGGNPRHTCRVSRPGPVSDVVRWTAESGWLGGANWQCPVVADNGAVYYSTSSALLAVGADGKRLWSTLEAGCEQTGLSIAEDGTIYVGDGDGYLCAYSPQGRRRWRCSVRGRGSAYGYTGCTTVAADGTVYLAGDGLHAVSPKGRKLWTFPLDDHCEGAPAVGADGAVFLASWRDGTLYCVDPDGSERWRADVAEYQRYSPSIGADGTVYLGCSDGKLNAYRPDGRLQWSLQTTGSIESAPAIGADGTIYVTAARGTLYAISAAGQVVWRRQLLPDDASVMMSSIAIDAEDRLYFGTLGRNLDFAYAYYPSGELCWKHSLDDGVVGGPAIGQDGSVYFKTMDGSLYAFGAEASPAADQADAMPAVAAPADQPAGFALGRIRLGMTLGEVRDYIESRDLRLIRDAVGEGGGGDGELLTHEHEYFALAAGRLSAYAPVPVYGLSEAEFRVLAAQLDADYPAARRGSGKADLPAGWPVMAGDVEDAARLEWWLDEDDRQLLVAGWRADDGYFWLWLTGPR